MPFSPRWLIHHDREEEARDVLVSLRGLPHDHPLLELEFLEIKAQSLFEKRTEKEKFPHLERSNTWSYIKLEAAGFGSLFKTWPMFRRVMVATGTYHQFYLFTYFSPRIYFANNYNHSNYDFSAMDWCQCRLVLRSVHFRPAWYEQQYHISPSDRCRRSSNVPRNRKRPLNPLKFIF